jgi:pheromone shutdown protein TraB
MFMIMIIFICLGERDLYMANAIRSLDGAEGVTRFVGVVGMAHVAGIENALMQAGYKLKTSNCRPGQ